MRIDSEEIIVSRIWDNHGKEVGYEQKGVLVRCKNCKHFQQNVWEKVNGIQIIVGHEVCDFWGDGCKTKEEGYCSYGEREEQENE